MILLSAILASLLTIPMSAQSSFNIAQSFMSKKGITLVNNKANTRGDKPYEIFNGEDNIGFAIVCDGIVVGYSTESPFDQDNIPCGAQAMLDSYANIKSRIGTRGYELRETTPIKPMITTNWWQTSPFNKLMPINNANEHCSAGCGAVALSQIIHYYRNYIKGCKAIPPYSFNYDDIFDLEALEEITFDWNNILEEYDYRENGNRYFVNLTEEQEYAIAILMKYVAYAIGTQFYRTPTISGSWIPLSSLNYFGFSNKSYKTEKWITTKELYNLLDKELPLGRPVLMAGYRTELENGVSDGHWFIIHGRDEDGRYHLNLGGNNGYYLLDPDAYNVNPNSKEAWNNGRCPYMLMGWCVVPIIEKGSTDISSTVITTNDSSAVYNLQGQVVGNSFEGLPKGLYIKEGKKYIVR